MLLIGKPSISMGHLYHGYVSHNQRVIQPRRHCGGIAMPRRGARQATAEGPQNADQDVGLGARAWSMGTPNGCV